LHIKPGSLRKIKNFHRNLSAELILLYYRHIPGPIMMNVRNKHLHDVACVQNVEPPKVGGGDFVSFNIEKAYFPWEKSHSQEGVDQPLLVGCNNGIEGFHKNLVKFKHPNIINDLPIGFPINNIISQHPKLPDF